MGNSTGVFEALRKDGQIYYRASITFRDKHISLGSFQEEAAAHRAYLEAAEVLASDRFHPEDYPEQEMALSFEKWVVLLNFRDNKLYIKTPIYLKKTYFLYYYSPALCLKFDTDDLFFYSNHKLMKRGNHLFVSEYGMQTSILSRYGIKSFAVEGRDYSFVNGDPTDFRYGNLVITNHYYGVRKEFRKGMPVYTTRIHVNGDFIIGRYPSEAEAAVAYNKAAALLREHGFQKNFPENYVTELDEIDYAKTYHLVRISRKFRRFCEQLEPGRASTDPAGIKATPDSRSGGKRDSTS